MRYFDEASSINFSSSTVYALQTLGTFAKWYAHRLGLVKSPLFEADAQRELTEPTAS